MAHLNVDQILESVREEDFVEYFLFPLIQTNDERQQESILNKILTKANKLVSKYTENYLWHKDEFKLVIRTSNSNTLNHLEGEKEPLPPHLYGISHFGDNIEDEWFMVFLLQKLTEEINGSIARIHDADGEFLLIEAADYLPPWAGPENCSNRVFLYEGTIYLIPFKPEQGLKASEAIEVLRENPSESLATTEIQNCLKNKLKEYPNQIRNNLHCANAYLPVGVAVILKHKPNLIAPAVQAFCNRDPVDLKVCRAMKYFPPENRIESRITFTKCLYAMLTHSKYTPDRRTGWNLPQSASPQFKSHILGVKIACGFEILASQAKPSSDIEADKAWHSYLESLKAKNYFQGLLEGSRDYNNLLNKAKEFYINHRDSMQYTSSIGQEILELTKSLDCNELKNEETLPDDDDSWLDITQEDLDKMLQEKYGQKKFTKVNNNSDPSSFTDKINTFLNHMTDIEGAEFPNVKSTKKPKVTFSSDTQESKPKINFDPNGFSCAVQNILNFVIPEDDSWDLDSDSDMSEYEDEYVRESLGDKSEMKQYMEQMDKELAATTIADSFVKKEGFEDIEDFKPVDIDVNALKNILASYKSQLGEAGPSSNMLGPMGVHLESNSNEVD